MTSLKSMIKAALAALDAGDVDAARRTLADASAYWDTLGKATTARQAAVVVGDTSRQKTPLPFRKGEWVMERDSTCPMFGIVSDCYDSLGQVMIDLTVYRADGKRLGRVSPACGGPRNMEPCLAADRFMKIVRPVFPVIAEDMLARCPQYAHLLAGEPAIET
ncbi:hypothetical protein [Burkholderia pseudomallei]|uniref:hypothetical protein n=1 Tax=Burkholderia pseudomallei TaxID=28450 RepID=UPI000A1A30FF|nr:hypothetical protein [Burkholderia pseudomallei]ARL04377.1 hypothetical protein BOC44_21685 [Burkholderia pseudomallei]